MGFGLCAAGVAAAFNQQPRAAGGALLALLLSSALALAVRRHAWSILCVAILPAIFTGYWSEFRVGATLIVPSFLVCGLWLFWAANPLFFEQPKLREFPLFWPAAIYWGAIVLSAAHAVSLLHWARGLLDVSLGLGFFLYPYYHLRTRRELDRCLKVLIGLAAFAVVFGVLQDWLFGALRGLLSTLYAAPDWVWVQNWHYQGRMVSNWLHPSYVGSVLNAVAPITLCLYLHAKRSRAALLLLYGLMVVGIFLTNTRTTIVAFGCAFLLFGFLTRRWSKRVLVPAAVTLLAMGLVFATAPDVFSRFNFTEHRNDFTLIGREISWMEALNLFAGNPITGIGERNFTDRAILPRYQGGPIAAVYVHNVFLQHAAETGAIGLLALLYLLYASLRIDFRHLPGESVELRNLRYALFCSSIATLLECLAENPLYVWQIACLFFLVRGLGVALYRRPEIYRTRRAVATRAPAVTPAPSPAV